MLHSIDLDKVFYEGEDNKESEQLYRYVLL